MAVGQPRAAIFQVFCLSSSILALSLIWVFFRKADLHATIHTPRHASVGVPLELQITLSNRSKRNLTDCNIAIAIPGPPPGLDEFTNLREPGELERNAFDRLMRYYRWRWLQRRGRLFYQERSVPIAKLRTNESTESFIPIRPLQRGILPLNKLRVLLNDPLGLFQRNCPVAIKPVQLVVLPRRYPMPNIRLSGAISDKPGSDDNRRSIGSSGEIIGLRDYRPGDALRQIHWKSWAHTGRPVVKELQESTASQIALFVDSSPGHSDPKILEELISVAASVLTALHTSDQVPELMMFGGQAGLKIEKSLGQNTTNHFLEILAAMKMENDNESSSVVAEIIARCSGVSSIITVLNGYDSKRQEFVATLSGFGIPCIPIVVASPNDGPKIPGIYLIDALDTAGALAKLPALLEAIDQT